jgi:multidrug efflux pump
MIGETTLAMLYVPLLFYLFDKLAERGKKEGPPAAAVNSHGSGVLSTPAPHAERRDD